MKYCINYKASFNHYDKVQEIKIEFDETENTIESLIHFFQKYPEHDIVVICGDEVPITVFDSLEYYYQKGIKNFIIALPYYEIFLDLMEKYSFNYFINEPIANMDLLHNVLGGSRKPKYVIFSGSWGFNLSRLAKMVHDAGVEIRVVPNIAQRDNWTMLSEDETDIHKRITDFFIRPEDVFLYEEAGLIDTLDLVGSANEISSIFHFYVIQKEFPGRLDLIIKGFEDCENVPRNDQLPQEFGLCRLLCNKKCYMGENCNACSNCCDIAEKMGEGDSVIPLASFSELKEKIEGLSLLSEGVKNE